MRVLRIEIDDQKAGIQRFMNCVRPNRYGAFITECVQEELLQFIPAPFYEFDWDLDKDGPVHECFFAFPPETFFKYINLIHDKRVIVAEYEVEPKKASHNQVIFHKNTARFISEIRVGELLS